MLRAINGNMNSFKKLNRFLNKPFPGPDSLWKEVKGMLIASAIVFFFLYLFKPFGLNNYEGSKLVLSLSFGLVSLISSLVYLFFTKYIIKIHKDVESWTMRRWFIDILCLVIFIALANYLFILYLYDSAFTLTGFATMLLSTVMVAIFPVLFFGYRKQLELERLNNQSASSLTETIESQHESESEHKDPVAADSRKILAIESMQNYVHVYKVSGEILERDTVRMTLTAALETYASHGLLKCHRSFLVNPLEIIHVSGNAQGLKLTLSHGDSPIIPVSRTYIASIKSSL